RQFARLQHRELVFERSFVRVKGSQLGAPSVACADELQLAVDEREVQLGDLVALNEHRTRLACAAGLERRQPRLLEGDRLLGVGNAQRRGGVGARDRAQAVETLEQV